jgi:hypothetical protein
LPQEIPQRQDEGLRGTQIINEIVRDLIADTELNLWAAYCLHFVYYNFCRVHNTLRVTLKWSRELHQFCSAIRAARAASF